MLRPEEFRLGQWSIPSMDADDLPECFWRCLFLQYKEFSTSPGAGQFYYFCAFPLAENGIESQPKCLEDQ